MKNRSLPEQIERIRLLTEGVKQNPDIKEKLAQVGFTEENIQ